MRMRWTGCAQAARVGLSAVRRHPAQACGIGGTVVLHMLALSIDFSAALPARRYGDESNASMQTTFYVGLGQARAAPVHLDAGALQETPVGQEETVRGSGALGEPTQPGRSQRNTDHPRDEEFAGFHSPEELDISALPISEPAYSLLDGLPNSVRPIKLRLFIDAYGKLRGIKILQIDDRDAESATRVSAMFYIVKFLPGRLNRKDTPSYLDIEFNIDDKMRLPPTRPGL